jgi:Uma2 family endonuclease
MTTSPTRLVTVEDVERLPDDGYRYALLKGVLYRMPPPKPRHGRIAGNVGSYLWLHVKEHELGVVYNEAGFLLGRDPDVLLGPDVAFVRTERVPDEDAPGYPEIAPDLAIEVVSPGDTGPEVAAKVEAYLEAGTRMVVVIRPQPRTVTVHTPNDRTGRTLTESDELDGGDVVPGFRLPLAKLFG